MFRTAPTANLPDLHVHSLTPPVNALTRDRVSNDPANARPLSGRSPSPMLQPEHAQHSVPTLQLHALPLVAIARTDSIKKSELAQAQEDERKFAEAQGHV